MTQRLIGLISGTSVDGIDAALVEISGSTTDLAVTLLAGETYPYPDALRSQILSVCAGEPLAMSDLAALDDAIAQVFAEAAIAIQANQPPAELIGSHGQTVFHRPPIANLGYSLQLGRGELIAHLTGIPTVSNFRAADIAAGGQGAPLVSPVDACLLRHPSRDRCVQNLGGIGNVTYLPAASSAAGSKILGWDTGPANALMDLATQQLSDGNLSFDRNGDWAAQGTPCQPLVESWLQQDFFHQPPPKSTGRERFSPDYLADCLADAIPYDLSAADILATLTELTAASIAHSYRTFLPRLPDQVLLCGGGSRNLYLKQRLQINLPSAQVLTTDEAGLNSDYKEAIAFAVLAYWRSLDIPGNLPEVTGASQFALLGEIHLVVQ
jgi:anhydro-N-acetylmuramic acid kinase